MSVPRATTVLEQIQDRARRAAAAADGAVLDVAARHLLDTAACAVSGRSHPLARAWLPVLDAPGPHVALGGGTWTLDAAVEVDATLAHLDEFDPLHGPSATAPGAVVVPVAVALAAARRLPGERLLRAVVAGYEAVAEAGLRFGGPALYGTRWWPTALFGALGAAAAAAELLDLDDATSVHAFALAVAPLGGLLSDGDLGAAHYLMTGTAAARGVRAARLAAAGLTGSPALLDGPAAAALGRAALPASAGGTPHVVGTALKTWPCARPLHTALAALDELIADGVVPPIGNGAPAGHADRGGAGGGEGAPVRIGLPTAALAFVTADRNPTGPAEAAASAAVAVAGALCGRARDPHWYRAPERTVAVEVYADPDLDREFPRHWGAVVTAGGEQRRVLVAPGDPDRPHDEATVRAKAATLLDCAPGDGRLSAVLNAGSIPAVAVRNALRRS